MVHFSFCVVMILVSSSSSSSNKKYECYDPYNVFLGVLRMCILRDHQIDNSFELNASDQNKASITQLQIQEGKMNQLPAGIFYQFPSVEKFICEHVGLKVITKGHFKDASRLKQFISNDNEVQLLKGKIFTGAASLERLSFRNNFIERIFDDAFDGLSNLVYLNLEGNKLILVSSKVLSPLKKLKHINLTQNQIVVLFGGMFKFNPILSQVELNSNEITSIDTDVFTNSQSFTKISLKENICVDDEFTSTKKFYLELKQCYDNFLSSNEIEVIYSEHFNSLENSHEPVYQADTKKNYIFVGFIILMVFLTALYNFMKLKVRKTQLNREDLKLAGV